MANILLYNSNEISPSVGGVERVAKIMVDGFAKSKHNVYVLYYNNMVGEDKPVNQFKIPMINPVGYIKKFVALKRIQIAINLCGLYNATSAILIDACKYENIKIISVFHNSFDSLLWRNSMLNKFMSYPICKNIFRCLLAILERIPIKSGHYIYENSDKIVLLSKSYITEYKFFIDKKADKVIAINNPLPFKAILERWDMKENTVLFVGRLDKQKGLDKLLRIWAGITHDDWTLKIVGDGPLKAELKMLTIKLGIDESVEFLGYQDPCEHYKKAKIFAMTSLYEGFPMVLIESMAYGCVPIIFNSYLAAYEIVKDNGYLIDAFDEGAFKRQLTNMMSCQNTLRGKSLNCNRYTSDFLSEKIISQWNILIDNLMVLCSDCGSCDI